MSTCEPCDGKLGPDVCTFRGVIHRNGEWMGLLTFFDSLGQAVNVSTWEFRAQLRKSPDSANAVADFDFATGPETNEILISIDESVRRDIPCGPRETSAESQYVADFLARDNPSSQFRVMFRVMFSVVHGVTDDTEIL